MTLKTDTLDLTRRGLLGMGAGAMLVSVTPLAALAEEEDLQAAVRKAFGNRPMTDEKVTMTLPPISENGYSVPLSVRVDSPMTDADHITQIAIFSPRNPRPDLVRFQLGPRAGKADISTRIRLSGTQRLVAIAEDNQGRLWRGGAETMVTLAACVIL